MRCTHSPLQVLFRVSAGLVTDDASYVTANQNKTVYDPSLVVTGAEPFDAEMFRTYRYSGKMKYTFRSLQPRGFHNVTLGFIETYHCNGVGDTSKRLIDIAINSNKFLQDYDVFATTGACGTVAFESKLVKANRKGIIRIFFSATVDKPMVSLIQIEAVY